MSHRNTQTVAANTAVTFTFRNTTAKPMNVTAVRIFDSATGSASGQQVPQPKRFLIDKLDPSELFADGIDCVYTQFAILNYQKPFTLKPGQSLRVRYISINTASINVLEVDYT